MRKLLLLALVALVPPMAAFGQTDPHHWKFSSVFPSDTLKTTGGSGVHGLAVDPDGKVWIQPHQAVDSIQVGDAKIRVFSIYVFDPDGTPASFSPIRTITVGGVTDTLKGTLNGRGLRADPDGNILVAAGTNLYKLNYVTGAGMAKATPNIGSLSAPATSGHEAEHIVFAAPVVGGNPLIMYDEDLNNIGNALDATRGFSRAFEVSPDGNKIFWAGYTLRGVILYEREDEFADFDSVGVVIPGVSAESFAWDPETGYLWLSAGSSSDLANQWEGIPTNFQINAWYAFDTDALQVDMAATPVDSIVYVEPGLVARPRAIDFSPDGDIAYVAMFTIDAPNIQKFTKQAGVPVEQGGELPNALTLEQNFPNPFNPSTEISFGLNKTGHVSPRVYDVLGREVATLVDGVLPANNYTQRFNASDLASGMYLYVLESDGRRVSRTMTLVR